MSETSELSTISTLSNLKARVDSLHNKLHGVVKRSYGSNKNQPRDEEDQSEISSMLSEYIKNYEISNPKTEKEETRFGIESSNISSNMKKSKKKSKKRKKRRKKIAEQNFFNSKRVLHTTVKKPKPVTIKKTRSKKRKSAKNADSSFLSQKSHRSNLSSKSFSAHKRKAKIKKSGKIKKKRKKKVKKSEIVLTELTPHSLNIIDNWDGWRSNKPYSDSDDDLEGTSSQKIQHSAPDHSNKFVQKKTEQPKNQLSVSEIVSKVFNKKKINEKPDLNVVSTENGVKIDGGIIIKVCDSVIDENNREFQKLEVSVTNGEKGVRQKVDILIPQQVRSSFIGEHVSRSRIEKGSFVNDKSIGGKSRLKKVEEEDNGVVGEIEKENSKDSVSKKSRSDKKDELGRKRKEIIQQLLKKYANNVKIE